MVTNMKTYANKPDPPKIVHISYLVFFKIVKRLCVPSEMLLRMKRDNFLYFYTQCIPLL